MCGFDSCYPCLIKSNLKYKKNNKSLFYKNNTTKSNLTLKIYKSSVWNFYKRSLKRSLKSSRTQFRGKIFYKNFIIKSRSKFFIKNYNHKLRKSGLLKTSFRKNYFFYKNTSYKLLRYFFKKISFSNFSKIKNFNSKKKFLKVFYKNLLIKNLSNKEINFFKKNFNDNFLSKNFIQTRSIYQDKNRVTIVFRPNFNKNFKFLGFKNLSNFFYNTEGRSNINLSSSIAYINTFSNYSAQNYYLGFLSLLRFNYYVDRKFLLDYNIINRKLANKGVVNFFFNLPKKLSYGSIKTSTYTESKLGDNLLDKNLKNLESNIFYSWSVDNILWSKKSLLNRNSNLVLTKLENFRITSNSVVYSNQDTRNVFNKTIKPLKLNFKPSIFFDKPSYTFYMYLNKFLSKDTEKLFHIDNNFSNKLNILGSVSENFNITTQKFFWLTRSIFKNKVSAFTRGGEKNKYKTFKKMPTILVGIRSFKLELTRYGTRRRFKKSVFNDLFLIFFKKIRRSKNYLYRSLGFKKRNLQWKILKNKFNFFKSLNLIGKGKKLAIQNYFNSTNVFNSKLRSKLNLLSLNCGNSFYGNFQKSEFNNSYSLSSPFLYRNNLLKFNNLNLFLFFIQNPLLLKINKLNLNDTKGSYFLDKLISVDSILNEKIGLSARNSINFKLSNSNLLPHKVFNYILSKKIYSTNSSQSLKTDLIPWYHHTLIRFIENCTGKKVFFQFYPFVNQEISKDFIVRYKKWMPRMSFYERRLGHKFFLEEALHILHIGFILKDPVLLSNWLKAMILRISFWKTKSIFRFLKYLLQNYYKFIFNDLGIKGLKLKLKGKISAAGNSRKRTILYRIGETSHSKIDLKVAYDSKVITTFTGAMGFQIWLFY